MEVTDGGTKMEIEQLIRDSCNFEIGPSKDFQRFHKVFLKFFFGVLEVEVDYENNSILTRNSKPHSANSLALGNVGDAMLEKVNYVNLEETLLGCLKEGVNNERLYKHLLDEFHRFSDKGESRTA